MNVARHVEAVAAASPGLPAIAFEDRALSYGALNARANQTARALARLEVKQGDRVALFLPNTPAFAVAYLAVLKLGAIAVSLNALLKKDEVRVLLDDCDAVALFTTPALLAELGSRPEGLREVIPCSDDGPTELEAGDDELAAVSVSSADPAAILYTSGTTGGPKGAVLTHGNITSNIRVTAACLGARPGDRHLLYLPLFHCFGQNFIMNAAFSSAGTLVLERRFDLAGTLSDVGRHGVTHFYGVPTIFIYLLNANVVPAQLASVRCFFSAAAPMPREVAAEWRRRFDRPIFEGYGLTETSPLASYNHPDAYRPGSIGTPIDGVRMQIVGEDGQPGDAGAWGEICIKGPNVMAGYFRREEETRHAVRDGWFHSGDVGYRDEAGYYYLVDRSKDLINCAGFKVWPREVEEVLHQHSAVEDCAVVGAPDPVKGELVRAFIKVRAGAAVTAEALRAHCRERTARYKVPAEIIFEELIPRNPAGKLLKRLLRGRA